MRVLVTGGAGYIGSHVCKALAEAGHHPVTYDDLSSGHLDAVRWGPLVRGDVRDREILARALADHHAEAVVHLAGAIEVGRSSLEPDLFWDINVAGTINLLVAMRRLGVGRLVFSSSAAVYGPHPAGLIAETAPTAPASPYGETKLACERMVGAQCRAVGLTAVALRYFNAAGADASGLIGERHDPETHLIPLALRATATRPLTLFGADFETPDGTCVRDYVHVTDLAAAHLAALTMDLPAGTFEPVNLGAGRGYSVRDVLAAVSDAADAAYVKIGSRRPGDPASLVANIAKAEALLGWAPQHSAMEQIVADALRWERRHL